MIAAMVVKDSYTHTGCYESLQKNIRAFAWEFPEEAMNGQCEFFYYIKADDPERFFFIRVNTKDREKFITSVRAFAEKLDFDILPQNETKLLLRRIKLDTFE